MKKSGFTLVELLAIIVVLAIIALLAVQAVLPTLDKVKKQLFATEGQRVIEAAETYLVANSVISGANGFPTKYGETKCISIKTLVDEGYFEPKKDNYRGAVLVGKLRSSGNESSSNSNFGYNVVMTNGIYILASYGVASIDEVYNLSILDDVFGEGTNLTREEKLDYIFNDYCNFMHLNE